MDTIVPESYDCIFKPILIYKKLQLQLQFLSIYIDIVKTGLEHKKMKNKPASATVDLRCWMAR
jgi:hypothetical protein